MLTLSGGAVNYYVADHLGSSHVVTNSSGTILDDSDFYPFGGERSYSSSSGNNYKFTGKERDAESGLDDFAARFYTSNYGRFLSPDDSKYSHLADPQTLNLYTYIANNPINSVDPTGHDPNNCRSCHFPKSAFDGSTPASGELSSGEAEFDANIDYTRNCIQDPEGCQEAEQKQTQEAQAKSQFQQAMAMATNLEQEQPTATSGPNDSGANAADPDPDPQQQKYGQNPDYKKAVENENRPATDADRAKAVGNGMKMANQGVNTELVVEGAMASVVAIVATAPAAAAGARATAKATVEYAASHPNQVVDFGKGVMAGNKPFPPTPAGFTGWVVGTIIRKLIQ